jgi:hypothetical protein
MRSRLIVLLFLCAAAPAFAGTPPSLGFASSFAALGGSVTNSGSTTVIAGNVGTSPGNTAPGISRSNFILGDPRLNDSLAQQAQKDRATAYASLNVRPCTQLNAHLGGPMLAPQMLGPGVYCVPQDAVLTGSLVLDARDPDAFWIFEIDGSLTTAPGSTVQTINEGRDNNIFWRISGSATFGMKSVFAGNVLAAGNITVESNATISGRLLTPGAVSLTDAGVTICCAVLDMAPHVLPDGVAGTDYSLTLAPKAGKAPYKFALAASDPGASVTVTEGGLLSVKSPPAGVFKLAVAISDATGISCVRVYRLVVCGGITLSLTDLPGPVACLPYKQTITASGGTPPYMFSVSAGLPAGLSLSSVTPEGVLSGTPTSAGDYSFSVTATDALGCTGNQTYHGSVTGGLTVLPLTLPDGTVGTFYSRQITAIGGSGSYAFSVVLETLPKDLGLSRDGLLSGPLTKTGCYTFTVTVLDTISGCTASRTYTVCIVCNPPIEILPQTLPDGTVGTFYSQMITAMGGSGSYTFSARHEALPKDLTLSLGGLLSGPLTKAGCYTFTVTVLDMISGCTASRTYTVCILCNPPIAILPLTLPNGTVGMFYSQVISATGGSGSYVFSTRPAALPEGLTLSLGGSLSGPPTKAGCYTFTVTVLDTVSGCTASRTYTVCICAMITIQPNLPAGTIGKIYEKTITAIGGKPPYSFTQIIPGAGSLPPGLICCIGGSATVSGTPTMTGSSHLQ